MIKVPLEIVQVGWLTEPIWGISGVKGDESTVLPADTDVQPFKLAVTVYVPEGAVIAPLDMSMLTPIDGTTS